MRDSNSAAVYPTQCTENGRQVRRKRMERAISSA